MESKYHRGKDLWYKYSHKVRQRVIITAAQWYCGREAVVPGLVRCSQVCWDWSGGVAVQEKSVRCVGEEFASKVTFQQVGEHAEWGRE